MARTYISSMGPNLVEVVVVVVLSLSLSSSSSKADLHGDDPSRPSKQPVTSGCPSAPCTRYTIALLHYCTIALHAHCKHRGRCPDFLFFICSCPQMKMGKFPNHFAIVTFHWTIGRLARLTAMRQGGPFIYERRPLKENRPRCLVAARELAPGIAGKKRKRYVY